LLYLFISTPLQLYAVQILLGLVTAFTFPSYMAIFTRHVDKNREGTEWALYYTLNDIGTAALAIMGGYLASYYGFPLLIIVISTISLVGAGLLIPIRPYLYKR
jgi:MFS family permease